MQLSGVTRICYAMLRPNQEVSRLLWREGIAPVFDSPDLRDRFHCMLGDDVYAVGGDVDGIRRLIERASLVIADLTGRDPSVTLGAGIAAALGKQVVVLLADTASTDDVPSDWQASPIIRYPAGGPAGSQIGQALRAIISERFDQQAGADVQQLLAQLVSNHRQKRREAEETLGRMAEPSTIRPLCELLALPDAAARASAGLVLRQVGGPQVTRALLEALTDERAYMRHAAAWVLREPYDASVVEALIQRLSDQVPMVRQMATWTLGELHARGVAGLLALRLLEDEDADVRRGAAEALGKLGDFAACPPLVDALRDPDVMVRQAAAAALGALNDPSAVKPLVAATRDESWMVRQSAARALGAIGGPAACEALGHLLEINEDVRWAAVAGLAAMNCPASRQILRRTADDTDQTRFIREFAATALGLADTGIRRRRRSPEQG